MKRRVCCLLLGICILCLPAQQVYAAPAGPAAKTEEEKEKKPKPHEHKHEKPVPPHEHEHPKPHEKKGPLGEEKPMPPKPGEKPEPPKPAEKPIPPHEKEKQEAENNQHTDNEATEPTVTPIPTAIPTETPTPQPTVIQTVTQPTTSTGTTTGTTASTLGVEVAKYALRFLGNPYKYGGTSLTNGADCSGFVQSVYAHFGYSISRTSREQANNAGYMNVSLKESELQPGDLIFYAKSNGVVYHVALYIGDGMVVHAANAKSGIIVSEYNFMKPYKARRVIR